MAHISKGRQSMFFYDAYDNQTLQTKYLMTASAVRTNLSYLLMSYQYDPK